MIAVIDYGLNNVLSVRNALGRIDRDCVVAAAPEKLRGISGIILPGVGSFSAGVAALGKSGLADALLKMAAGGIPLLGICLGMQMLAQGSEEASDGAAGLGLIEGFSVRFDGEMKVPHMGWNRVQITRKNPLMAGLSDESYMYFAHSYYLPPSSIKHLAAVTDYGVRLGSVIGRDNVWGVQFHPEKSGVNGLRVLDNFAGLTEECQR